MSKDGVILLVEDNPDDYEATVRGFRKNHIDNPIQWCKSGQDAYDYLYRKEKYAATPDVKTPILILLDLNLPGMDGRQLLGSIKADEHLRAIPILVLTTSNDPTDVNNCYALGASTYIQKPVGFQALSYLIQVINEYWFNIAILPIKESEDG